MQNDLPMTINRLKSKQEIQFQYGGSPFFETGSSFILAVDWDSSSKFVMQIDIHFLQWVPLRNLNMEVDFRFYGRHLEKSIWRHNSAANLLRIKIGSKIPIWRPSFFLNRKYFYLNSRWRYIMEIWYANRFLPFSRNTVTIHEHWISRIAPFKNWSRYYV